MSQRPYRGMFPVLPDLQRRRRAGLVGQPCALGPMGRRGAPLREGLLDVARRLDPLMLSCG
jgi:hypothetical protein